MVIVLTWWCEAIQRLMTGEREPIKVRFMEGPYLVEAGPIAQELIHLVLVEARQTRMVCYESDVDAQTFIRSILSAADRTITECKARGWWSHDADRLLDARNSLRVGFQEHWPVLLPRSEITWPQLRLPSLDIDSLSLDVSLETQKVDFASYSNS